MKKWLDNYGKKENANEGHSSASKEWMGEGYSNVGRNYSPAWGGSFEEGGMIPQAQNGTPTRGDSLEVYNNAVAIRNYYENLRKKGWYQKPEITTLDDSFNKTYVKKNMDDVKRESLDTYRKILNEKDPNSYVFKDFFKSVYPNTSFNAYLSAVAKSLGETKSGTGDRYYYKDLYPNIIDPIAPSTLVNLKIPPNERVDFYSMNYSTNRGSSTRTPPGGIVTGIYTYDPLSVKPYDMRTPQEKIEWEKKYGKKNPPSEKPKEKPKPKPEPEPSLKKKVTKMEPKSSNSKSTTPQLRTIEQPNIELPDVQRGKYRTSYYDPQMKDWNERAFMSQQESDQFADEMSQRGYPGSYGNVTQRTQFQTGGTLSTIFTDNPNNPRLKRYSDSSIAYNHLQRWSDLVNTPGTTEEDVKKFLSKPDSVAAIKSMHKTNIRGKHIKEVPLTTKDSAHSASANVDYLPKPQPVLYRPNPELIPFNIQDPTANLQLRTMQHPDVQMSGAVPQGNWNVEYLDPTSKKTETKHFITNEDAEQFYNDPANAASRKYSNASSVGRMQLGGNVYPVNYVPQAQNGITSEDSMLNSIYSKWPALKKLGDVSIKADESFTRDKTGVGDIEFFSPNTPQVTYNNGYVAQNPGVDSYGILYNPSTNDEQNIRLDMLHGMAEADPRYRRLRNRFERAVGRTDIRDEMNHWYNIDREKGNAEDGRDRWMDNYTDGQLRTLLFEGDRSKQNYSDEEANQLLSNPRVKRKFNKLNNYLQKEEFAMGGSIPGSVGFTYARTNSPAPSNGPYAKKTKASAQNGTIHKKYLPEKVENWQEPKYVEGLNSEGHYGYSNGVINYDPNSEVENINNPWWLEHEKYHHLQTLSGRNPKERRQQEIDDQVNEMIKSNPGLQFVPKSKLISGSKPNEKGQKSFVGAGDRIYENPSTLEGEARLYEDYISSGGKSIFPKQENGGMTYYQNGLDWKPKMISKNGSVIEDDMGQWAHPGEITEIGSNRITMQGVPYPVLGISDTGDQQMMYPGEEYKFKGNKVTEYPITQKGNKKENGGWLSQYK